MKHYNGFGIGLRPAYYQDLLGGDEQSAAQIDWLEIISEDFLLPGSAASFYLQQLCERFPVAMHGVSMSIGSCDPLDMDYLKQLKALATRVNPLWISDHLCWTGVEQVNSHDLLPMPFTQEAIKHLANKISQAQDYLGRQLLFENISTYVTFKGAQMSEWEFINAVTQEADCLLLLDINNIYVNSFNHGFDANEYLNQIDAKRVYQYHMAGHLNQETHIIDTHDAPIIDPVWDLYRQAQLRFDQVATLIERDDHLPPLNELVTEVAKAREITEALEVQA